MQPRTSPGEPPPRVGGKYPVHRDDPQEIVGRCPGAAADAGPDRPLTSLRLIRNVIATCAVTARASDRTQSFKHWGGGKVFAKYSRTFGKKYSRATVEELIKVFAKYSQSVRLLKVFAKYSQSLNCRTSVKSQKYSQALDY